MISSIVIIILLVQEIDGIIRNIPHRTSNDRYMDPCKAGWKNDFSYEKISLLLAENIVEENALSSEIIFIREGDEN